MTGRYGWNGSTVPLRRVLSKSMSKGTGVTEPLRSTVPDFGIFMETANVAGPATGQVMALTSAERSLTVSVVRGLTASSLNASSPLRSVICSTFTLKSGLAESPPADFGDSASAGCAAAAVRSAPAGGGLDAPGAGAVPFSFGGPA